MRFDPRAGRQGTPEPRRRCPTADGTARASNACGPERSPELVIKDCATADDFEAVVGWAPKPVPERTAATGDEAM